MKKVLLILICFFHINLYAEENKKVYFAGGCFWCMEESFDKVDGVISVVSGYSGGHLKNPTYADVVYTDTGHVEAVEVTYDPKVLSYEKLLDIFWKNIDPFDAAGQFCEECKTEDESVKQNLIMHSYKICNSCNLAKTIFPI